MNKIDNNMKKTIRLRESELRRMIAESVRRVLNEENEEGETFNTGNAKWAVINTSDYMGDGKGYVNVFDDVMEVANGEEQARDFSNMNVGDVISSYDGYPMDYDGVIIVRIQ